MRFCCGWQNTVLISRMRCSSVFLSVVLFTLFCQTAESAAGQCEKIEEVCTLCKETSCHQSRPQENDDKQLEYYKKSSNNKLEDGDEKTCVGAQKEKKIYRVRLKEKRTSKAFVQVYLSGSNKYFNCTIANADQCSSFVETKVTGGYVVKSAQCSPATKQPRWVKLQCNGNEADLRNLELCEIRVYSLTADCEDYWWDAEGRCFKKCNCLDGAKCDQWNGTCPPGKEPTTAASTTLTTKPTTAASTTLTTKPTTAASTTLTTKPTTAANNTLTTKPTTAASTTLTTKPTTAARTTLTTKPTTAASTTLTTKPTTAASTTLTTKPTTAASTTLTTKPTTAANTTLTTKPTTAASTTLTTKPTTAASTTLTTKPTTAASTTLTTKPTTAASTTLTTKPTTAANTTLTTKPTTAASTTLTTKPTTAASTTLTTKPTTAASTTLTTKPTTAASTTPTTKPPTAASTTLTTKPTTAASTTPTTKPPTAASTTPTTMPSARVTSSPSPPHTPSPLPPSTTTLLSSTERATTTSTPQREPSTESSTSSTTTQQPTQTPTIGGTGTEGDTEMPEAPGGNPVQTGKSENSNGGVEMMPVILGMSAMVLLALVILAAVGLRRVVQKGRNKSEELVAHEDTGAADPENQTTALQVEMKDLNGPSSSSPVEGQGQDSMYANVSETFSPTTEPTEVEAFRAHICQMTAIGGFDKEFQALPKGIQDQVTVADKVNGEEKKKNRFRDILPYDDSRVLLAKESDTDCDYINASYIDGFVESMAYIAAQGPLVDTLRDFWHMVWTDNCGKIVMLTNLCEGAKIKCEQYWPVLEGTSCTFGCYTIMSTKVTQKAQFIHRVLSVTKAVDQDSESETAREIHQFHFTSWPDHGVPCAVALVQFWSCVTSQPSPLTGPLLVHCSAGIGRTGTFIALDMLSYQAETTGKVSVFPTVKRLRKQRVNMVQTVSQYKFLHEVVGEWLAGHDTQVKREELVSDSPWTKKEEQGEGESGGKIPSAVREKIRTEFEMLTELRPEVTDDQVSTAKLEENSQKNRSLQVLPVEQYRVRLWTIEDNESDYINAVFLPSLTRQQGYIVTQLPLEGTVGDFWRMVLDWRVKVVVRFMDTPEDEGMPVFPTEGEQVQHGPVNIHTLTKSTSSPGVTAYTLQLKRTEDTETEREESCNKIVTVYCVESSGALSLEKTGAFVSLVNTLLPLVTTSAQPPVLVQCFNGAGPSCVLSAVMMAAEALEVEGNVSPFLLTRFIHMARPQAFRTQEEYEFMFRCLLHHAGGITDSDNTEDASKSNDSSQSTEEPGPIYNNTDADETTDETTPIYNNA